MKRLSASETLLLFAAALLTSVALFQLIAVVVVPFLHVVLTVL